MVVVLRRFKYKDCVRAGLLRKIPPSKGKADKSVSTAHKWLDEAQKDFDIKAFNSSVIASYMTMFHSARAILFLDGFREKSHYCIARYLEEKYMKKGLLERKWINLLDHTREIRHESQYDVDAFATEGEAESMLKTAKEFVERMKILLDKIIEMYGKRSIA